MTVAESEVAMNNLRNLMSLMARYKLTAEKIGEIAGCSSTDAILYATGEKVPPMSVYNALAEYFKWARCNEDSIPEPDFSKWTVVENGGELIICEAETGKSIALVENFDTPDAEVNARLIASAPEMYSILKELVSVNPLHPKYKETVLRASNAAQEVVKRVE